jgi:hypothetical protein
VSARPFRLTAPEPLEQDIHEACAKALDALLLPPAFWFSAGIGAAQLSPQQAVRLTRVGVKRGLPDVWVIARRLYGIEIKTRGGQLSKTRVVRTRRGSPRILDGQADVFPRLLAAGVAEIAIVHSVDEMLMQLAHWEIPLRARITA